MQSIKILILFFLIIGKLESTLFIDISKARFTQGGQPKNIIRVVLFDTEEETKRITQGKKGKDKIIPPHFIFIEYRVLTPYTADRNPNTAHQWLIRFRDETACRYDWEGNVGLDGTHEKYHIIIRTFGKIIGRDTAEIRTDGAALISHLDVPFYTCLYSGTDEITQTSLQWGQICLENQKENSDELGILGELATNMIFAALNREQLPSKYEDNHGFDGVYREPIDGGSNLYLTESKCRAQKYTAEHYHEATFKSEKIRDILAKMKKNCPETHSVIISVLDGAIKGEIYTQTYRIVINKDKEGEASTSQTKIRKKMNGFVEIHQALLEKALYKIETSLLSTNKSSPEKDKLDIVFQCAERHGLSAQQVASAMIEHMTQEEQVEFCKQLIRNLAIPLETLATSSYSAQLSLPEKDKGKGKQKAEIQ